MRIKEYTSQISGEVAVLVDDAGMPLQFANRYAYEMIVRPGKSLYSVKQAICVISRLYLWAEIKGVDLNRILFYGEFLDSDQIYNILYFIQFNSSTQNEILKTRLKQIKTSTSRQSNIISFKNIAQVSYKYTANEGYANRLRILRKFLKWVIVERPSFYQDSQN